MFVFQHGTVPKISEKKRKMAIGMPCDEAAGRPAAARIGVFLSQSSLKGFSGVKLPM